MKLPCLLLLALAGANASAQQPAAPNPFSRGVPQPVLPTQPNGAPLPMPAYSEPAAEYVEENVQASRIGQVNGMHIYKGDSTYYFESTKNRIVRRQLSKPTFDQAPSEVGQLQGTSPPALPSSVGKPNLRK